MLTDDQLKQIEDRCEKATPDKWDVIYTSGKRLSVVSLSEYQADKPCIICRIENVVSGHPLKESDIADAQFIAASRSDIPALLATIKELKRELLPYMRAETDRLRKDCETIKELKEQNYQALDILNEITAHGNCQCEGDGDKCLICEAYELVKKSGWVSKTIHPEL